MNRRGGSGAGDRRPPRWARWLLSRALPDDVRDDVTGDLEEVWRGRVQRQGATRANAWFGFESVAFAARFTVERTRDGLGRAAGHFLPSWIDVKLGMRMLGRTPLLTVTGCVAIATAIGINAGFHEFMRDMFSVMQPVPGGERVVAIRQADPEAGATRNPELGDVRLWQDELESVENLGIAIPLQMNVVGPDGRAVTVEAAEMTGDAFRLAGGVPALGRPILSSDDGPSAAPVAVVSHGLWRDQLAGDPQVIGSTIRLGETLHTVVGVASDGFRFPISQRIWTNLRRDPGAYAPESGPPVLVFGRLAEGTGLERAQAELDRLAPVVAENREAGRPSLRPQVALLEDAFSPVQGAGNITLMLLGARLVMALLLVVAAANVAVLVFARNAAREGEIAVRTALGAGRGRILTQLFVEAMVLALLSAGVGLLAAHFGLLYGSRIFWEVQRTAPPFWWDPGISSSTVIYSLALATLGAGIVGLLPGLRATGRGTREALQVARAGGGSISFGFLPTAIVVAQVALSVTFIPLSFAAVANQVTEVAAPVSFEMDGFVTARLDVDSSIRLALAGSAGDEEAGEAIRQRFREMREAVRERLEREPGVRRVAFTNRLPGLMGQSLPSVSLEVDGRPDQPPAYVMTATVGYEYFDVVGREVVAGRPLERQDYSDDARVALVNREFERAVLGGRSAVGQRVRPADPDGDPGRPWTEIVGVIPEDVAGPAGKRPQIYHPMTEAGIIPVRMLVEVAADPEAFAPHLRSLVAEAEPGVILDEVYPLVDIRRGEIVSERFFVVILFIVAMITMLLSVTGVYSLMSFIVTRRTREIGVRAALGAGAGRIVMGVFSRALTQLGIGAVAGAALATFILLKDSPPLTTLVASVGGVALLLVLGGLVGCAIPLMRALAIQPTEALRAEG